ncbi:MAG: restriction endonuclease subunit S [Acidiferrobacterales bacterium]
MEVREASANYVVTEMPQMPKGYKQTEVGVIPEDWDVTTVGEISDVKTGPFGSALHERDYVNEGTPIITVEHLGELGVLHSNLPLVSDTDRVRLKAYSLRQGDIVFSRVGSVDRNALIRVSENGWLFSGRLLRVRPAREIIHPPYLSYHFHSETFKQRVRDVAVGQTMASINTRILKGVKAVLPPTKSEQEAIAEALSDADALIESLEHLLVKKRQLKQGAMQELLTGKRRLPGFSGEWGVRRLGDMLTICHGKSQREVESANGPYPILATGGQIGWAIRFLYDKPSVLIGRKGTIDQPQYMGTPFWTVDTLFYSVIHESNHAKFLFYRFCLIDWKQHNEASGVPSLNARTIENIQISSPGLEEQTAIATILSDIDNEIAALEENLTKARHLKQGMMQELLTGRIRLL